MGVVELDRVLRWVAAAAIPGVILTVLGLRACSDARQASLSGTTALPNAEASEGEGLRGAPSGVTQGAERPGAGSVAAAAHASAAADLANGEAPTTDQENLPAAAAPERARQPLRFAAELPAAPDDLGVVPLAADPRAPAPPRADAAARGPCGGMLVRLITTSVDPAWSFASIAASSSEPAALRHVGDSIGSFRVDSIEWDRVWLVGGGVRCAAVLNEGVREARAAVGLGPNDRGLLSAADDAPPPWHVPSEVALGIRRRSATELWIDPRAVELIFARGAELFSGARLDPVRSGDEVIGVELASFAPDSLLDRLGIEPGDVLRAVDEQRAGSLDGLVAALTDARARQKLVARLARGDAEFDLEVLVQSLAEE